MDPPRSSPATNPPSRAILRRLIREVLRTDADLNSFCVDFFPDVYDRFSTGMDRLSKVNLLLELSPPGEVVSRLREHCGAELESGLHFDAALKEWARPELENVHSLRDQLEALYRDREERRIKGLETAGVDQQLVELKRLQRQVPKLQEGEVLADRYRLLEVVGRGGFANVWQAMDRSVHRLVAVKVLHVEQGEESRRIERFIRGARQMQSLDHPHIVRVLDGPDEYHGFHFFVMDYVTGGDLSRAVIAQTVDREAAFRAILQVGEALEFAHQRGLIHRDIKPQNILLDESNRARLTDFDLVWAPDSTGGTRTGAMGTFLYAAPEEMEDASRVDRRVDIYSLAMTLIFVLHGKSLPRQVLDARVRFIDRLECPDPVKALLRRATAPEREERPNSVAEFCAELERGWSTQKVQAGAAQNPQSAKPERQKDAALRRPSRLKDPRIWLVVIFAVIGVLGAGNGVYLWRARAIKSVPDQPAAQPIVQTLAAPAEADNMTKEVKPPSPEPPVMEPPQPILPAAEPAQTVATGNEESSLSLSRTKEKRTDKRPFPTRKAAVAARGASAKLTVLVRPWALVYVGGKRLQQTPVRNYPLKAGAHKITLTNDRLGKHEVINLKLNPGDEPEIKRNWN